jgi:hypothetical protein
MTKPKSPKSTASKASTTSTIQPTRHATTLSITNMSPKPKEDPTTDTEVPKPQTAVVHDLTGFALLALPPRLRTILGDAQLVSNTLELAALQITAIVRETGVVVYLNLPVTVMEMETPGFNLTKGSMTLRDIVVKNVDADEIAAAGKAQKAENGGKDPDADLKPPKTTGKGKGRA